MAPSEQVADVGEGPDNGERATSLVVATKLERSKKDDGWSASTPMRPRPGVPSKVRLHGDQSTGGAEEKRKTRSDPQPRLPDRRGHVPAGIRRPTD